MKKNKETETAANDAQSGAGLVELTTDELALVAGGRHGVHSPPVRGGTAN